MPYSLGSYTLTHFVPVKHLYQKEAAYYCMLGSQPDTGDGLFKFLMIIYNNNR